MIELDEREILQLEALSHHEGYQLFQALLEDIIENATLLCRQPTKSQEEIALHNERVGFINGLERAKTTVTKMLAVYHRQQ